jgi:hypothetical protein
MGEILKGEEAWAWAPALALAARLELDEHPLLATLWLSLRILCDQVLLRDLGWTHRFQEDSNSLILASWGLVGNANGNYAQKCRSDEFRCETGAFRGMK